jgi:hypothetical protein
MKVLGYTLPQIKKAVWGFCAPIVPVALMAVQAASPGGTTITAGEWLTIAGAAFGVGGGVFALTNTTSPAAKPAARHEQPRKAAP